MKCMSGVAKFGLGTGIIVMLFSLLMVYVPDTGASPDVAGEVWFESSEYFTDSVAVIYINDSDLAGTGTISADNIEIYSDADPAGISITLTEESTANGTFRGTFTFVYNDSSDDPSNILNVTDRNNVTVNYTDASPSGIIQNHTTFNYTINATILMNATIFGLADTVLVNLTDNDTNTDSGALDSIYIEVTSPSDTNITVALNETGVDTGVFEGNFTFAAASDNASDVLGISEGDMIVIYVTDSLNTYGNSVTRINTSSMAKNATILFDNITYYPADTAVVEVYDNDSMANTNASLAESVTVNITKSGNDPGINITLTETGNDTGVFNGTFTFVNNGTSSGRILNVTNGETITAAYTDIKNGTGGSNTRVTNSTPTYYYTVDGDPNMDLSLYGPNSTVNITLNDSDLNSDQNTKDSVNVAVNTTTVATGITVNLLETGVNTGIFQGNFTFSIGGNTTDANDLINASHNDDVNVIYNDSTNSSGDFAFVTANATFYSSLNAIIGTNGTYLNSTYVVLPVNSTVIVNLTDRDPFANTNTGARDIVNVTISNADTGCVINLTLNETGVNTGIFEGNFSLNESTCNTTLRMMTFSVGEEDWLDINYTDLWNGTADANVLTNSSVMADNRSPQFLSISSLDSDLVYNPGDMINISVQLDQMGSNLSVNFSVIDSEYVIGAENVTDWGNGTYMINYTIASNTSVEQGSHALNITAYDKLGNGPASNTSFSITLSKLSINETQLGFTNISPRGSYTLMFNVSNDGGAQALITETITTYKEYEFGYDTSSNETRTFYFIVPENSTVLNWSVTSNESWAVLSQTLYDYSKNNQSSDLSNSKIISVSSGRSEVWYMVVSAGNISADGARITPKVFVYFSTPGWFNSSITSGTDNFSANSNTSITMNLTIPYRGVISGMFNGTIVYSNPNASVSVPFIFNITSPEQRFESNASSPVSVMPNGTITLHVNLMRGFNTLKIDINNTGNINLTGVWANLTTGTTTKTNFTDPSNRSINISAVTGITGSDVSNRHNMTFQPIGANSSAWIKLQFNTSEQTIEGVYTTYLSVYSVNGQPYNESNLTLRINLTPTLNVTVLNITYNDSDAMPRPGDNITINLSVRYQNGDAVTGLVLGNFSIYDIWTTGSGSLRNRTFGNLSIHSFSLSSSGIYMFNYTVPDRNTSGRAEYELHTAVLEAWTSNDNIGNGTTTYNMSAPNINISFHSFSVAMGNVTTDKFSINIANNGSVIIYNVSVNFTKNDTTNGCVTLNVTSCPVIGNITVNENVAACSVLVSANTSKCTSNITFKAGGVSIFGTIYNVTQISKIIDVTAVSGSTTNGGSGGGGGSTATCTSDSSCSTLYFCNSTGYCERISCAVGFIANHKCIKYTYGINILNYTPSIYVLLNSSNTTEINVNNTKNTTTIKTELNLSTGITGSVSPSEKGLGSMENYTFNVTVSVSNDTKIGNYSGTFLAYKSDNKSINDSISFTVVVMPHEERIVEINHTYENYSSIVEGLERELEEIKAGGLVSLANLTIVERHVNNTRLVLNEINAAISEGDYAKAEGLFEDLETYINDARVALDSLKLEQERGAEEAQGALIIWIIIGMVIAIAAGFLIYMFFPSKGYPKYRISGGVPKPSVPNKLKRGLGGITGRFHRRPKPISHKLRDYARGYERNRAFRYEHREGPGKKLKKLFKKK